MNNEDDKKVVSQLNNATVVNSNSVENPTNIETEIGNVEQEKLNNQVINQQQNIQPVQPIQTTQPVTNTTVVKKTENILKVENPKPTQIVMSQNNNSGNDNNHKNEEQNKKEEDDYKGPSIFRKITTILLFIFLFLFVYFLGDITEYINLKKEQQQIAEISNGKLLCTADKSSKNLDLKYTASFTFENKEITNLVYTVTSTGDKQKDKTELEQLNKDCKTLETEVKDLEGIRVICSLNNGVNSVKQIFDYANLDTTKVDSAFSEAGGVFPQFKYKDNIDKVESKMLTSGYTCDKTGA